MSMGMKPTLPPVAAFRLLADLNNYLSLSPKAREAILADYMAAKEQRETMLAALESDQKVAEADRAAASVALRVAKENAEKQGRDAETQAREIVGKANAEATLMKTKIAEDVEATTERMRVSQQAILDRQDAVQAREDACEEREANAFREREEAVVLRERNVEQREREAEKAHALGQATKQNYEALLRQINALGTAAARGKTAAE